MTRVKNWPLRLKITLGSALVVGLAIISFGTGVSVHLYNDGMQELEGDMAQTTDDFFSLRAKRGEVVDWGDQRLIAELLPQVSRDYLVQIEEPPGTVVHRSATLAGQAFPTPTVEGKFEVAGFNDGSYRTRLTTHGQTRLRLAASLYNVEESREDLLIAYCIALPIGLLVAALGGWWLAGRTLRPVEELTQAAERITAQNLDQRLPVPNTRDELGHLTVVFNSMIDRLQGSFEQARRFTADASHELKTPLTIIRGEIESALTDENLPPAQEKVLLNLLEETGRLSAITQGLLLLSRADAGKFVLDLQPLDFSHLVNEMAEDGEILAAQKQVHLEIDTQPDLPVAGNPQFLRQLVLNLLENAVKYNTKGGRISVKLARTQGGAELRVGNTGPGIPPEHVGRIFDRFYRGDAARDARTAGHGLGLSICREIARAHGAELAVAEASTGWTEFVFTIPSADPGHPPPVQPKDAEPTPGDAVPEPEGWTI